MPQFDPSKLPGWRGNRNDYHSSGDPEWVLIRHTFLTLPDEWQVFDGDMVIGTFPTDIEHGNALQILAALGAPATKGTD